jgi:DNA polymerase III sliding clamp (beta) subunit (PCNA family)
VKAKLDAGEFKRIIDNTKRFVGNGMTATLMQWIYLEIDAKEKVIRATALEGHRISIEYANLVEADESFTCYIRPSIPKITKYDNYAELEVSNNRLYVQVGESIMGYVQPEGQYYPVDKMLKEYQGKEKLITVGINAKYLRDALDSISAYDSDKKMAKIDIYDPISPVIIRTGRKGERENLKIVLPVRLRDE